jgi:hypothetical protein
LQGLCPQRNLEGWREGQINNGTSKDPRSLFGERTRPRVQHSAPRRMPQEKFAKARTPSPAREARALPRVNRRLGRRRSLGDCSLWPISRPGCGVLTKNISRRFSRAIQE